MKAVKRAAKAVAEGERSDGMGELLGRAVERVIVGGGIVKAVERAAHHVSRLVSRNDFMFLVVMNSRFTGFVSEILDSFRFIDECKKDLGNSSIRPPPPYSYHPHLCS